MKGKRFSFFALLELVVLLVGGLAACGGASNPLGAPEIVYGQDICDECGMIISDAKFAAATIDTKGTPRKFDDVGEMVLYHMKHPDAQVRAYFVHDYNEGSWLRGETAFYVRSPSIISPMGLGIAAFGDKAAAEAFAEKVNGQVLTFDQLRLNVHLTLHH